MSTDSSTSSITVPNLPQPHPPVPTTDYEPLIASLLNPETLTDDALYQATAAAQTALKEMQDEYMKLDREISLLDPTYTRKPNPRKLLDPAQYRLRHEKSTQDTLHKIARGSFDAASTDTNTNTNTDDAVRQKSPKPPFQPQAPPRSSKSGSAGGKSTSPLKKAVMTDQLAIDMNVAYPTNIPPKRERKPLRRLQQDLEQMTSPPPLIKKEPTTTTTPSSPSPSPPPRSIRKRARTLDKEDGGDNELLRQPKRRATSADSGRKYGAAEPAVVTHGKDPRRSEAMRKAWAKRQAAGTNGRYGGAPKVRNARGRTVD
ncbi:MAG: hypothetical protein Q9217_005787 [Psora testacea]